MTNWDVFKAIGGISDEAIEDARLESATSGSKRKTRRRRIIGAVAVMAACTALVLGIAQPWKGIKPVAGDNPAVDTSAAPGSVSPDNGVMVPAPPWDSVYIPPDPMPEAPEPGVAADMMAFFIYNGRMYVQTGQYADPSLREGYVCTVTGDIDEWSGADECVEGASSIGGDVYSVKGYDTNFRLCMDGPDGLIEFYDCLSDMTLYSGADLFETCLHVENYVGAYYILDADWEEAADNRHELDPESLEAFVALLMASPMQDWGAGSENGDIFDCGYAEAHLYFELADGTTVPLRLFENGCVMYGGSAVRVCAYMPGAIFDAVFEKCT